MPLAKRKRNSFNCICKICNDLFISRDHDADTCSHSCAMRFSKFPHPKFVTRNCSACKQDFETPWNLRKKRCCSQLCANLAQARVMKQIMLTNNPMHDLDTAARASATRKDKFTNEPGFREQVGAWTRQAWADGKYEGVAVGRCDWYEHEKPDGTKVKLQGTWELKYAQWLDSHKIPYVAHPPRIPYVDENGLACSYYPDFYLTVGDEYVDTKNPLYERLQQGKFECIRLSNPSIKLRILGKEGLMDLGIKT